MPFGQGNEDLVFGQAAHLGVTAQRPVGQEWDPFLFSQREHSFGRAFALQDAQFVLHDRHAKMTHGLPQFARRHIA